LLLPVNIKYGIVISLLSHDWPDPAILLK